MGLANHAEIVRVVKALTPQMARRLRKCAKRKVGVARFELGLDVMRLQGYRPHACVGRRRGKAGDQRRQEMDHADIGQQEAE